MISLRPGMEKDRDDVIRSLIDMQYDRNEMDFHRGTFRVRGDVVEIIPAYESDVAIRIEFFGDEVDRITEVDVLPEQNYMLKYQNSNTTTSHLGTKWYGVIAYLSNGKLGKIAFWYTSPKVSKALYDLTPKSGGAVSL